MQHYKKIIFMMVLSVLFNTTLYAQNKNYNKTLTWNSLGIGIHNKGEIKDWTYYGIKTPHEASLWIDALKPLGSISYAGAARIWKQNGFDAKTTKAWVLVGVKGSDGVKRWKNEGIETPQEVQKWKELGITEPWRCASWKKQVYNPTNARKWMNAGYSLDAVAREVSKGNTSPAEVIIAQELQNKKEHFSPEIREKYAYTSTDKTSIIPKNELSTDTVSHQYPYEENSGENYQVFLLIYFIIMIVTMFKGYGENRTVVIFRDYNDLGLTFLIPVSFFLIFYLFMMLGGNSTWGGVLAFIVSLSLFGLLLKNTYEDNNNNILPTILSFMTKVPLGIIWILSFMTMLNPGGKTAKERRKNRASALIVMGLLTPIITMLVVKKEGSLFNPRDWIKGKRISSIRNHL